MQETPIAYRVAFETANLEFTLIQAAMSKLRQEKQRIEGAFASKTGDGALVIASELTMRSRNTE